jgi:membrane associated rhomboid family serine protease
VHLQTIFATLIILQFMVVTLHDWVDIPGWTHGKQVQTAQGRWRFFLITLVNGVFPGLAAAFLFLYPHGKKPAFVINYWLIYCAVTVISAVMMWYVPYFLGADEKTKYEYGVMYAGTKQILPLRGDNPRPNLLHLCFHVLFLATFGLALAMRFS